MLQRFALSIALAALFSGLLRTPARADSVAQIATSIRIDRGTATLIDPQGRPGEVAEGSDTAVRAGDVLTFFLSFTPVPNGGVRGLGGYVTIYIPANTEVVGARLISRTGNTVAPHRGGYSSDGTGPRGSVMIDGELGGSMSQLYADTGIFYTVDDRLTRVPGDAFIGLGNGLRMDPRPTAFGQLAPILLAPDSYAHNRWDVVQAYAFGTGGSPNGGRGNTPDLFGSPVAGPQSFYTMEAITTGADAAPVDIDEVVLGAEGPWQRIRTLGAEIGARGAVPPVMDPGPLARVGVPAVAGDGTPLGRLLHAGDPLPALDPDMPAVPYARALRYAVGELVVGEEYRCEFSLRVVRTPLDPVSDSDVICGEVFGGDASAEAEGNDGKDNSWRYFLPAPACVSLNLLFDLDVDKLAALEGEPLTYTIRGKNLSTDAHDDVVVRYCYENGEVDITDADGGTMGDGTGCPVEGDPLDISWDIGELLPGEEFDFEIGAVARGGGRGDSTIGRAIFTSRQLPDPGFQTIAFTVIKALTVLDLALEASPDRLDPPGEVTYTGTVTSLSTGDTQGDGCAAGGCRVQYELPEGFTFVAGSATLDGVANVPTAAANFVTFTDLNDIAAGGSSEFVFRMAVPAAHPAGAYRSRVATTYRDEDGETVHDSIAEVGEVVVGTRRSDAPVLTGPLFAGTTSVGGNTTEGAGATIRVYLNGVAVVEDTSGAGGNFDVTTPTLFVGQGVFATAQSAGELESLPSVELTVVGESRGAACSDGIDNDGDGDIDFPDDADCDSPDDVDEASTPACADGIDNDGDGDIDYPADLGCSSLLDTDETGGAECSDGLDNDGDGDTDFPDDEGCESADDRSESRLPQCANGIDDDGDGNIDFPFDAECADALDDDESTAGGTDAGPMGADAGPGGSDAGPSGGDGGPGGSDGGGVPPPDPGGVDAPSGGGCACRTTGAGSVPSALLVLGAFGIWQRRRWL